MPNWCNNGITIRHKDPAMIDRVIKGKDGLLMEFLPTPQELVDTEAASYPDSMSDKAQELRLKQEANFQKYGAKDWYDWNCNNWGTKWDFNLENIDRPDPNTVTAAFDTAWAPPIEAYNRLLEMGFEIEAMYYEPGMCFVGKYDNGVDDCIEYAGETAATVREAIGEELDDYFGISEEMAQYEEEE